MREAVDWRSFMCKVKLQQTVHPVEPLAVGFTGIESLLGSALHQFKYQVHICLIPARNETWTKRPDQASRDFKKRTYYQDHSGMVKSSLQFWPESLQERRVLE
jgi:hypothetical protein